jgi:Flp pilus assembly protein TadB
MPENDDLDPGASTQMFQAFVDRDEPESPGRRWMRAALVGAALAALVIVFVLAWLVLGG